MTPPETSAPLDALASVRERYAVGAAQRVPELCCPVDYDASLLAVLPPEIVERDYGCGDPSRYVRAGDRVLDLGSGAGKICYMASQLVGPAGSVLGVDATPEMLALAREWREELGRRIGHANVEFRRGHIQDLALDLDRLDAWLCAHPVDGVEGLEALRREEERLRAEEPLVPDASVDLVLSNCVLNLVDDRDKTRLFAEIHRVLREGGRCAISDIVSDEDVPDEMRADPGLWTGCISGAMREDRFVQAFADAGLHGVEVLVRQREPWAVVQGIEFRSLTVVAWKGGEGVGRDRNQAVLYRGPWKEVRDDRGHVLRRGEPTAVCDRTFATLTREPYAAHVEPVPPVLPVDAAEAPAFERRCDPRRAPAETKRGAVRADVAPGADPTCSPSGGCC